MPKEKKVSKPPQAASGGRGKGINSSSRPIGLAGAAVALVFAVAYTWRLVQQPTDVEVEPVKASQKPEHAGMGPEVMSSQTPLLEELMTLLTEVSSAGEGTAVERDASLQNAQKRLKQIENVIDGSSEAGKQQLGLVSLVRSALEMEAKGEDMAASDWNEDTLMERHGVATYASQQYWDTAYADNKYGDSFDWYGNWAEATLQGHSLADVVRPLLRSDSRILVQGCGNSAMSSLMYADGFKHITNVDVSEPVIKQMRESYGHLDGMTWEAMDATALDFAEGMFDVVIEKGMFDALFAGTGVKTLPALREARRVLKLGGRLISVSFNGDRVDTLFHAEAAGQGLRCRVLSELNYKHVQDAEDKKDSKDFFVYACDRG